MGRTESSPRAGAASGAVAALAITAVAAALAASAGCGRGPEDARAARFAAERYIDALSQNDLASLRQRSTCVVPSEAIIGGMVLRVDGPRTTSLAALDSLSRTAEASHRTLDSLWALVPEGEVDSLFLRSEFYARRHLLYRNALRAVTLSLDGEEPPPDTVIRTCRVRVRMRYYSSLVGPKPIDREHILRLLAAPGGRWIVFSAHLRQDDPRPEPI